MPTGTFDYRNEAERLAIERAIAFVAEMHASPRPPPTAKSSPCARPSPWAPVGTCSAPPYNRPPRRVSTPPNKKRGGAFPCVRRRRPLQAAPRPGSADRHRPHRGRTLSWLLPGLPATPVRRRPPAGRQRLAHPARPGHGRPGRHPRRLPPRSGVLNTWRAGPSAPRRSAVTATRTPPGPDGPRPTPGLAGAVRRGDGGPGVHIDAGKVNTPDGYRDVKVAVFACRGRAAPAAAADYEQRDLPAPRVRR